MSLGRTLRSYVWWTHERGSVHYDVMVTLILAFIFVTPHLWNYGDRPKPDLSPNQIVAQANPAGGMIYVVPVEQVRGSGSQPSNQQLGEAIAQVAGPVIIDRTEAVREIGGSVVAWRVWAHR